MDASKYKEERGDRGGSTLAFVAVRCSCLWLKRAPKRPQGRRPLNRQIDRNESQADSRRLILIYEEPGDFSRALKNDNFGTRLKNF